jgi:formiminotetrahydrofolate cyclodeaminase
MLQLDIPDFLQLPAWELLNKFGEGGHKPGSGSAAALLGLVACKMLQTVVTVTGRHNQYATRMPELAFVDAIVRDRHEPFFRSAVQRDSEAIHRYQLARQVRREATDPSQFRELNDQARDALIPATDIPLDIAQHAIETAERGIIVFDLGAHHVRGDSGVAISAALSACSVALFVVYLNLLQFREGIWAAKTRATADTIALRYQKLQLEQFSRVARIQAEGINSAQLELPILSADETPPATI